MWAGSEIMNILIQQRHHKNEKNHKNAFARPLFFLSGLLDFFSIGYSSLSGSLNEHYIYYHFGIYVYALGILKKYFCN